MEVFKPDEVIGDEIKLAATHRKHFGFAEKVAEEKLTDTSFSKILKNELTKANQYQLESDELAQKLAVSPKDVNIHDVMIAAEKAEFALNFVRVVRDKVVRAFQELINMR